MSTLDKIGGHAANTCIGAVVCCFDVTSGGAMTATGLAGLAIARIASGGAFDFKSVQKVQAKTVASLKASPDFRELNLERVAALLSDDTIAFDVETLRTAARTTQPERLADVLATLLSDGIAFDGDTERTRQAVRLALGSAMTGVVATQGFSTQLERLRIADTHITTAETAANVTKMMTAFQDLKHATRDQLESLATRFRIPDAFDLSDAKLRAELEDRATDYRRLRAQVDALDDRVAGLANLKAAAQDALDRLALEEAAQLFAHIRATQQELASETATAEADTLLLLDRVEAARDVLLDTADAYRRRDRATWLRLMHEAGLRLYRHGLKRSGPAMRGAADIWGDLADADDRTTDAETWAATRNNLGNALQILGERGDDAALQGAVIAFRGALEVHTRDALPFAWATTLNNLGNALRTLGERGDDAALQRAVTAYRAALEVHTRDARPLAWAGTQTNLGVALQILGERGDDAALRDAVTAFRAAHGVRTRTFLRVDWAITQNNLGNALRTLGQRGDDAALRDAVTAFRAALEVRTRDALPVDWAMTRENMALCFEAMAKADPEKAEHHLAEAFAAVEDALTIYTPEHMPFFFDKATRLRDRILAAQNAL